MKKSLLLLALGVLPCLASAQPEDLMLSSYWDFYSDNRFSIEANGRGNAGMADKGGLFTAILNPASLDLSQGLQFAAGYGYKTKQPWLKELWPDVGEIYLKTLPLSILFGLNYGVNNYVQAGLFYFDAHSYRMDTGTNIAVDENGVPVDTFWCHDDIRKSTLLMPLTVELAGFVRFGLGVYVNRLTRSFYYSRVYHNSFYSLDFQPGLLIGPINGLSVGLTYRPGSETKYSDGYGDLVYKAPAFLGLGLKLESPEMRTSFYFDFNNYWHSDIDPDLKDRLDTGLGIEQGLGKLKLRAGYFTVADYRRPGSYMMEVGNDYQYFLTGGATYPVGPVEISLSLMDSHLLSPGVHKMTQVACGLNYRINKKERQ